MAATLLGMTQSGVSHAIAGLEQELGITLLHRGRAGVEPTEAGERVLGHARELLSRAETIRQEASAYAGVERGSVRLASIWSVAARLLPGILAGLRRRHPGVEVALFEGTDQEVADWVATGAVDVGLLALPADGLETLPIARDILLAAVPAGHELAGRSRVRVEQIADQPFIMSKAGCEPLIRALFRDAGLEPAVRFEAREVPTILGMVQEGLGVSIVPALAAPRETAGLRLVPLEPPVCRDIAIAVRSLEQVSPAVDVLIRQALDRADS